MRNFKGQKFDGTLDVKEIAKLVRQDIKKAIKEKKLPQAKYSVTIDRYSMGQSIRVEISKVESHKLMLNTERVMSDHNSNEYNTLPMYSVEGKRVLNTVQDILDDYNRDNSDTMSDYYNVHFYSAVEFCWAFRDQQREEILKWAV